MILLEQLTFSELFIQQSPAAVRKTVESDSIRPFWNPSVRDISEILWLPPFSFSCGAADITLKDSWFSAVMSEPENQGITGACLSVFPDCSGSAGLKTRKIRIYPDEKQKSLLRQWLGTARFIYNQTVAYLGQPETSPDWFRIKTGIIAGLPEWAESVPYQIKSVAIRDACTAVKNAKTKCKKTGQLQDVKFRSKREKKDSVFIPKKIVKTESFYTSYLGKKIKMTENMPEILHDCRLKCEKGKFRLCVPVEKENCMPEIQRYAAALDPGVRTFQTFYSPVIAGKIGAGDFGRIHRLCKYIDNLYSRISRAKCKQKRRLMKAAVRIREKIKNLINEIHHKTAYFLCKTFDLIFLPSFESSRMVTKLHSKTARAMLTWAHYRFAEFLKHKAGESGTRVVRVCEAYTSKTCSACGKIHNIGSKKVMKCQCGTVLDRDVNGARGIFLRALRDTSSLNENSVCIC